MEDHVPGGYLGEANHHLREHRVHRFNRAVSLVEGPQTAQTLSWQGNPWPAVAEMNLFISPVSFSFEGEPITLGCGFICTFLQGPFLLGIRRKRFRPSLRRWRLAIPSDFPFVFGFPEPKWLDFPTGFAFCQGLLVDQLAF